MIDREALRIRRSKGLKMCKAFRLKSFTGKAVGRNGTTPCPCSCWMCGNPRLHRKGRERLTLQERREFQSETDDLEPSWG